MNRGEFQELAHIRLTDAKVLLDNECYDGAYYLAGYVIECALKACIAKRTREFDFPDKQIVDKIYSHKLTQLLSVIGIQPPEDIEVNWAVVKDWSEQHRYKRQHTEIEAKDMYEAVSDPDEGVLEWIKQHW
ncbi:HEPN domain-containing protein [Metabacillus bambusae]|uniref:HEPN domain-containing protein n=1 Tax=Metabacillus bambusae TaxID=2795218 RepID=A0ABS3NB56_9BACI|nr:HEPN domain-containing protein [Metabacillus bambusae]MBO1515504.1 HEPN domain-containing protein [Metabacillus bambusae]